MKAWPAVARSSRWLSPAAVLFVGHIAAQSLGATCAVGVVSRQGVILASDSLETSPLSATLARNCKIRRTPNCAVTVSGVVRNNSANFDFAALAEELCDETVPVNDRVTGFRGRAKRELQREIDFEREHLSKLFQSRNGMLIARVLAGVSIEGNSTLVFLEYAVAAGTVSETKFRAVPSSGPARVFVACSDAASGFIEQHPEVLRLDPNEIPRRIIQHEIGQPELPPLAGPPIAMVSIGQKGTKWISPGVCSDNSRPTPPRATSPSSDIEKPRIP